MRWSEIRTSMPVPLAGLRAFMERWAPGSTARLVPATDEEIAALAASCGGVDALPPVYREFLAVMGRSTGGFTLMWGSTAIGDLLADLGDDDEERRRPDVRRYLKFAIGEDDYNGRHPDDFFDLARPTPDGLDAALVRMREEDLAAGKPLPPAPFATFSDLLRAVFVAKVALDQEAHPAILKMGYGRDPSMAGQVYEFLAQLGFAVTELGASPAVVPLESVARGAIALLTAPSATMSGTLLRVRARAVKDQQILGELLTDHRNQLLRA